MFLYISVFTFLKKKYKRSESRHSDPSTSVGPALPPNSRTYSKGTSTGRSLGPRHHSPHIYKKDKMNPQEALRHRCSVIQPEWSPQDAWEGDGIIFLPRCSEGELRTPWGVIHWRIPAVSSFFFLVHAIRKEAPSLKVKVFLPKSERTGNQIARSSWSKNSNCHPWWRHPVTTTKTSHVLPSY